VSHALFFDGRSTEATPVDIYAESGLLYVNSATWRRVEVARSLSFTPAYARSPARVSFSDGAMCEIPAADFLPLRTALAGRGGPVEFLETRWRYALASLAVIAAMGILAYVWGIPLAAEMIVAHAPRSLETRLGRSTLEQMQSFGIIGPPRSVTRRERLLSERFAKLAATTPPVTYVLDFRSFPAGPNAFALPDGTIVVSSEIQALSANDDAMMFVMAHELGHVYYRHAVKLLARATLTSILIAWYAGDVSNALAVASAGAINLRFSREAEAQADAFAIGRLHAAHISTRPAADLFRAMQSEGAPDHSGKPGKARLELPDYLDSHPATSARIRELDKDGP
jgi:Zn-dependent protease with chaperone function